jgi:hypothetical protein
MAITLKTTITKPEGAEWYGKFSPESTVIINQIQTWVETLPGFLGQKNQTLDANTRIQEIKFDTLENYQNFRKLRLTNADWQARLDYNNSVGITAVVEENVDP